jgi:hypothetical protein
VAASDAAASASTRGANGAIFDASGAYRYALWRAWDPRRPGVCFVMLNPSAADAAPDVPTIRRCLGFARSWGFGALHVVNLFAFRAAGPRALKAASDPVGPDNDGFLAAASASADLLVAAWGNHGIFAGRAASVVRDLLLAGREPLCLGRTRTTGEPRHPLYVPRGARPVPLLPEGGAACA